MPEYPTGSSNSVMSGRPATASTKIGVLSGVANGVGRLDNQPGSDTGFERGTEGIDDPEWILPQEPGLVVNSRHEAEGGVKCGAGSLPPARGSAYGTPCVPSNGIRRRR